MKIAYFNYIGDSLPVLIRSFELTRAAAALGCEVTLFFFHERIRQPEWVFSMLDASMSDRFHVVYKKPAFPGYSPTPTRAYRYSHFSHIMLIAKSWRFFLREIEFLRSFRPDVVVARPDHVGSFTLSCKLFSLPLVFCTDGPAEELAYIHGFTARWPVALDTMRARHAGAMTVISETCRRLWLDKGFPAKRLFLCPNGADPEVFKPLPSDNRRSLRADLGIPAPAIVIGFAGNQRFWHGLRLLLKVFAALAERNDRLRLLVAGPLEDKPEAGIDAVPEALGSRIRFTGQVDYRRMPEYLDCMDLFVMPYPRFDIFHFSPMKMFEALSMGKIIVAPAQGQIAELLGGLPSAFLYDPADESALARRLREAIDAFVNQPCLGGQSRELAVEHHTWRKRGEALVAACRFALEERQTAKTRRISNPRMAFRV